MEWISLTLSIPTMVDSIELDEESHGDSVDQTRLEELLAPLCTLQPVDPTLYSPFACVLDIRLSLPKSTLKLSNVSFGTWKEPLTWVFVSERQRLAIALAVTNVQHSALNTSTYGTFHREQVENRRGELYFVENEYQLADILHKGPITKRTV
ncbi:hypothetical protein Tco_1102138 [Tanacetum coccineum]